MIILKHGTNTYYIPVNTIHRIERDVDSVTIQIYRGTVIETFNIDPTWMIGYDSFGKGFTKAEAIASILNNEVNKCYGKRIME